LKRCWSFSSLPNADRDCHHVLEGINVSLPKSMTRRTGKHTQSSNRRGWHQG
ncbi:uncharacterized protein BX663DRAFT_492050, partial [Cokeromyces recurvatus]|uniref:uncharacterized protein n=1 Tax=Cokeromyces recurvatus TaxID=90255 RepID=UPI00221F4B9E